jgi:hypothetical protein
MCIEMDADILLIPTQRDKINRAIEERGRKIVPRTTTVPIGFSVESGHLANSANTISFIIPPSIDKNEAEIPSSTDRSPVSYSSL